MRNLNKKITILALGICSTLFGQTTCFQSDNNYIYEGGSAAKTIAKGDFDNDGDIDVIMGNRTGSTPTTTLPRVTYIENNGNRSFAAPVMIASGANVIDVQAGDLDNNGNLDIVAVNFNQQRISVIFGNGDGTFQNPVVYSTSFGPNSAIIADLNNDNFLDVAVVGNGNVLDVFLNSTITPGTFSLLSPLSMPPGAFPASIDSADFDHDGNIDLVTANNGGGSISVLSGNGTGTFTISTTIVTDLGTNDVITRDFNGDGFLDVASANMDADNVSVLMNDGTGNIGSPTNYNVGDGPIALEAGDFNEDSKFDLAVVNSLDNTMSLLLGTGAGAFSTATNFYAANSPTDLIVDDFDGDTHQDVIHACLLGATMPTYWGDGTGQFELGNMVQVGDSPRDITTDDFDGDGDIDFAVVNYDDNTASIYLNDGLGNYTFDQNLATGSNPISIESGDLDGNGNPDIVVVNYTTGNASVYLNTAGVFSAPASVSVNSNPLKVRKGDFDNDGKLDIFVVNEANQVTILPGNGSGGFSTPLTETTGNQPKDIAIGDFDNDGKDDFVVPLFGANKVSIFKSTGTGFNNTDRNVGTGPIGVAFGDFNNDGAPEILVANYTSNDLSLIKNNGAGLFSFIATTLSSGDAKPISITTGDFNGDGNNDAAVTFEISTASTGNVVLFTGDGNNNLTFDNRYSTGMKPVAITTADLDNNGSLDLTVVNEVGEYVSVMLSSSSAPVITASGPTTICGTGSVTLTSTAAANYLWSTGETTQSINVSAAGNYSVTTSAPGGGCSATSNTITISNLPTPTVSITGITTICQGDATTITASGADTYQWSDALGTNPTQNLSPTSDKTYQVVGINSNGCKDTFDIPITVNPLPDASFTGLVSNYCINASASTLTPTTAGGSFSGPGISGSTFDPSIAGTGSHTIIYNITDGNSCSNSSSQNVNVVSAPDASFTGLASDYCVDASSVTLTPSTTGGTFSGTGVSGNTFDPSVAGVGTFDIVYVLNGGAGCVDKDTQTVVVNALPDASFTGLASDYCANASAVTLSPTTTGGAFSGSGISGNTFDPSVAGAGVHSITYNITDGNGCSNTSNQNVNINALPDASFTGLASDYCVDASTTTLVPITTGGTFSGTGVSGSTFDPNTAGIGTHTITYSVTDGNGCSNSENILVDVHGLPNANFTGLASDYCLNASAVTLTPSQAGGNFSGAGISGNTFNPSAAGSGVHSITYNITDGNGCSSFTSQSVTINALPDASFTGLAASYCVNSSPDNLSPTTSGGTFSGPGIFGAQNFKPSNAGVGTHTITYTLTDGNGCTNSSSQNVNVVAAPDASFTGLASNYCVNDAAVTLTPTQAGGTFSGTGVSGNTFDPSAAGSGVFTITYTINGGGGCTDTQNETVNVNALPNATFTGLASDYCENASAVTLTPNTIGGAFSGTGISGNTFDPSVAGSGIFSITYSITDGNGCSNSHNENVTVNALPDATFTGLASAYCVDASATTLTPNTTGGVFSGTGISGNTFDPSVAGTGSFAITYNITDGNGCSNSHNENVIVNALPDASFTGLASDYCANDAAVTLSPATGGGNFSGTGISGSTFDPSVAGSGTHTVTYNITDGNGCSNLSSQNVNVKTLPDAAFTGLASAYCVDASATTLTPNTTGGAFSGTGISGSTFDPSAAGSGTFTITYTVTGGNGCSNAHNENVVVNALPDATFTGLASDYCVNSSAATLTPNTAGGVFSGAGMSGSTFDPSVAGSGTFTITYNVTDGNGCSNLSSQNVNVNTLPDASFTGLASDYCANASAVTLTPTQTGGTFSGTGISGNTFDPSIAGAGTFDIVYVLNGGTGCIDKDTQTVVVNALPDATFTGLASTYCVDASATTLTPNTIGGAFSGTGISGNTFDPSVAGIGSFAITYNVTDGNGCSNSHIENVIVNALPDASFTGLASDYCANDAAVTLSPATGGGNFSGTGISGSTFDPSVAGSGTHTVTYNITDGNGCSNLSSQNVNVKTLPDAAFTGLASAYCVDASATTLTPNTTGGAFSGTGISGSTFDPSAAGSGTFTITYTVTGGNGCSNAHNENVVVNALPDATFTGLASDYCVNSSAATLTPNTAGGVFSGAGMSGSTFDPSVAGSGTFTITYNVTDGNGCSNLSSQNVNVNTLPDASFTGLASDYCANASAVTLTPTQTGGTFSGTGISGNTFDPSVAGSGIFSITYSITDGNGCSNSHNENVTVNALPDATFTGLASDYCVDASAITLTPNTSGGVFSGAGVSGNTFDPSVAGVGTHTITYSITNGAGCSDLSSQTVEINNQADATFTGLASNYCENASAVTLTPNTAGGTFSGAGVSGNTFNPSTAGIGTHSITYSITAGACSATSNETVTINAIPDATFTNLEDSYCIKADPIVLIPTQSGGTFSATSGLVGNTFYPQIADMGINYVSYTITNGAGCTNSYTDTVEISMPPFNTVTVSGTTLIANEVGANITYQWITCDNVPIIGETNQSFTPTENGSYAVEISNGNCTVTSSCYVMQLSGIKEFSNNNNINVYPNPNLGQFKIDGNFKNAKVEIFNASGKLIYMNNEFNGGETINLQSWVETGMYMLKITEKTGNVVHKKIIIRKD